MVAVKQKESVRWFDWFLVIGLVMAPMTSLRFWKIGPAELLVFIWCVFQIRRKLRLCDIFRFFGVYLALQLLGGIWCYVVAPEELAPVLYTSWFYLGFVAVYMYIGLRKYELSYVKILFQLFARISVIWYLLLYLYSQFISSRLFGAPLWFGTQRFTGGANNPHQVATLMCGLSMWFAREIGYRKKPVLNLLYLLGCCFIVGQTQSSTGILSISCGAFSWILFYLAKKTDTRKKRFQLFVGEVLFIALIVVIFYQSLMNAFLDWVSSDKNGMGRLYLYSQVGESFLRSPLVGLGPGWHVFSPSGEPMEIHNTYLEVLVGSGGLGFAALILFTYRQVKKIVRADTLYLPIIISIYAYGFAGFALRKLVYWGITAFVLVIVEKESSLRAETNPLQPQQFLTHPRGGVKDR